MSFLTTTLAFVFVLGIIIFVHEFGHLITAKAFGMRGFVFSPRERRGKALRDGRSGGMFPLTPTDGVTEDPARP